MASLHVSGNKELFSGLRRCAPISVQMADGGIVVAMHSGTVQLRVSTASGRVMRIQIDHVYFHERFSANLLSWNVLRADKWEFHSTADETFVTTPGGTRIKLSTRGRVSVMDSAAPERAYLADSLLTPNVEELILLHDRLGHLTFARMVALIKGGGILDVKKIHATEHELREAKRRIAECSACNQGKGTRTALGHRGLDKGRAKGETLHMDTFHVSRTLADGRPTVEYGLTVTDPHTQWRWLATLQTKDEVAREVIAIIKHATTQLDCRVKRLHSDGGTEFINHTVKAYCKEQGIELNYSPARTQQLNGVAENAVRSIKDAARTLLHHAGAPDRFWSEASCHATFLWNRTHVSEKTEVTPYESMYGKPPSARHIGVWGCDVHYHVPKEQRRAFDAKMEHGVYLGHDVRQNCAIVYILSSRKTIRTRDINFHCNDFEHMAAAASGFSTDIDRLFGEAAPPAPRAPPVADRGQDSELAGDFKAKQDEEQYEIEAIVGQRTIRGGTKEYRVRWSGYDEETWQPADQLAADAPDVVQNYLAALPAVPPPRHSPRFVNAPPRRKPVSDHDDEESSEAASDDDAEPRVHMAMCALRGMQPDKDANVLDSQDDRQMAFAVATGIAMLEQRTPETYRAAVAGADRVNWQGAMDKEMASCAALRVWDLVPRKDLPRSANILPVKWVYKIKTNELGEEEVFKARLTPKGFKQKAGKDFFEVYARTGMYKSMRVGLSLAAKWDHELDQIDVPTAFLNADVDEEVHMELPEGYREGNEGMVCRLRKALYGLKQAPRNWYLLFSKFLVEELGLRACVSDPCLFQKRTRTGRLMLLFLFVDDGQVGYHLEDRDEWNELKAKLVARFKVKDMGASKWILGMDITRNRKLRTITLGQKLYVTKAAEKYGFAECRVAQTPEVVGAAHQDPDAQQNMPADRQRYMEIVGTLMYACISTRLDIAHACHYLASHMLAPTRMHMAAAERVLRYLAGTKEIGLIFGSRNIGIGDSRGHTQLQVDVCAYADADWANNKLTRRSVTGWVAKLNGDPVSWTSKAQRVTATSTCEAELYAEAAAICEVLWLRGLVKELGLGAKVGSVVYGDNQSAIAVSKNGIKGEKTKHIDVKYHFVTETVERGDVQLKWIPTAEQQADIFTKALAAPAFELLRGQLMTQ